MSIPILFIHRTDNDYLYYVLRQAKYTSPHSDVILIGSPSNRKYASDAIKHALISDYFEGAANFARVYKHMHPCEYEYVMFCFQRWFVIRDYMRRNHIEECWVLDTDVMVFTDLNRPELKSYSWEAPWTTFIRLHEIEEYCNVTQNHFSDPSLFEHLKRYTRDTGHYVPETGMIAISEMVTHNIYFEQYAKRARTHGIIDNSLFDGNLFFSFPGVETLGDKKKIYLLNGNYFCKKIDSNDFIQINALHFTSEPNKAFIRHFYSPSLSAVSQGAYYFDYHLYRWIATSLH